MSLFKKAKSAWKNITGNNDKPKMPKPVPQVTFSDAAAEERRPRMANRGRRGRGRDSTIITQRSEIGSRTLLG